MHNREAATSRDPTSLGDIRVPQHETPAGHLVIHIRSDAPRAINRKLPTGGDTRGSSPGTKTESGRSDRQLTDTRQAGPRQAWRGQVGRATEEVCAARLRHPAFLPDR